MDFSSLRTAIQSLKRIDENGALEECLVDVAESSRGPAIDLDRHPEWRYDVARFARIAASLFGVPAWQAREAAIHAFLPDTQRSIALDVIDQHEQRILERALREIADRKLSGVSRRRVRA